MFTHCNPELFNQSIPSQSCLRACLVLDLGCLAFYIWFGSILFSNILFQIKIKQVRFHIKNLSALTEGQYESDECLKIMKTIDKAYDDRLNRVKIADMLVESNYPGKYWILFGNSFHSTNISSSILNSNVYESPQALQLEAYISKRPSMVLYILFATRHVEFQWCISANGHSQYRTFESSSFDTQLNEI